MADRRAEMERLRREWIWRKCKKDEKFALQNFWYIKHPASGKTKFDLRDTQNTALDHWAKNRYSLTLKARQIGWSTIVAAHAWYNTFFHPDREIIMISRNREYAMQLLDKSKYGMKFLPEWMLQRGPRLESNTSEKMIFSNGSSITSAPSEQDPARGSTAWLVIVDEWAFMPNGEQNWASIEPVAQIGGRVIGLSTANGSGNFFHKLWVDAEVGANQFKTMFFGWDAVPERDEAWYTMMKDNTLPWIMAQEYPSNPTEAFIKSGNPVFDVDKILQLELRTATPRIGYLGDHV